MLGPLFVIGARQVMKKALAEDKRDLERGTYAPGLAAGHVEAAFAPALAVARPSNQRQLLVDAACLICVSDGQAEASECDAILRLAKLLDAELPREALKSRLDGLLELEKTDAYAAEVERVGAALGSARLGPEGVLAACVVALVSEGMSSGELAALERLAKSAGVSEEQIAHTIEAADNALTHG